MGGFISSLQTHFCVLYFCGLEICISAIIFKSLSSFRYDWGWGHFSGGSAPVKLLFAALRELWQCKFCSYFTFEVSAVPVPYNSNVSVAKYKKFLFVCAAIFHCPMNHLAVFPRRSWRMGTTRGVWTPSGDLSSHSFVDGKVPFHQPAVATNLFLLLAHLTSFLIPFSLTHYTQNKVQRIFKEIINQNNSIAGFYGKICNSYQGQGL